MFPQNDEGRGFPCRFFFFDQRHSGESGGRGGISLFRLIIGARRLVLQCKQKRNMVLRPQLH
jgi:hypothetical protein